MEEEQQEGGKEQLLQVQRDFPFWKALRRKFPADNSFFAAGNLEREFLAKQASLDITEEERIAISSLEEEQSLNLSCPIVGCGAKLKRLQDLETHYVQRHSATCSVCSYVFPTARLLSLHVSETHDSFFQAKVERNFPMYECLLEGCPGRFLSDARRLQHLVDKHQFPRSFRFHSKKKHLSQHQRQRHKQHAYKQPPDVPKSKPLSSKFKPKKPEGGEVPFETEDKGLGSSSSAVMDIDNLTSGISRLSTASKATDDLPKVISFGRRGSALQPVRPQNRSGPKPAPAKKLGSNRGPTENMA